jgi:hypothetical protein
MTNSTKLLKINFAALVILTFFAAACSKDGKDSKSIVQVNNASLTEEELKSALSNKRNAGKYREEYIQNWIENEVLYQEAVDDGILDEDEYKTVSELSNKKLAVSLYLEKILAENKIEPTADELFEYYDKAKEDFKLNEDAFNINYAEFNNMDNAIKFRSMLLESDWNKAANTFRGDASLQNNFVNVLKYEHSLQPEVVNEAVSNLMPGEISIVLQTGPSKFTVVQLNEKLSKNSIPPFESIKERLKEQYIILKQKEFIHDLIDKLVEDHNVEIKRYKE